MKKVLVASKNPVKINAAKLAFEKAFGEEFEIEGISVQSGVSDQPMTDEETLAGAENRVENLIKEHNADYYIGIEGGCSLVEDKLTAFAWVVVKDSRGKLGRSRAAELVLPDKVKDLVINEGKELGDADDIVFGRNNSKQDNGTVGILTQDLITRTDYYTHAAIFALIPFMNKDLY